MKLKVFLLMLTLIMISATSAKAQVTIGANLDPNEGSLLDLKESDGSVNSTKGLGLPRVDLTHFNKLHPMLGSGYTDEESAKHIGLVVYNVNPNPAVWDASEPVGPRVWDGSYWQPIKKQPAPPIRYWNYSFTGMEETFIVPETGTYRLEVWGAGSPPTSDDKGGGEGGYSSGVVYLKKDDVLTLYVGGSPEKKEAGYNGGGSTTSGGEEYESRGSGGATDIRIGGVTLFHRLIVAGGAGGGAGRAYGQYASGVHKGGAGGGLSGTDGAKQGKTVYGRGGTQIAGGTSNSGGGGAGAFGIGGSFTGEHGGGGAGGGGWYGGSASGLASGGVGGGGGGSGWVFTADTYATWQTGNSADASQYQVPTDYYLTNAGTTAGTGSMPDWSRTDGGTMTGNAGNGHARITLLNP